MVFVLNRDLGLTFRFFSNLIYDIIPENQKGENIWEGQIKFV